MESVVPQPGSFTGAVVDHFKWASGVSYARMAAVVVDKAYRDAVDKARLRLDDLAEHYAPAFLRLAVHDALTWDASSRTGGANASIRTEKELSHAGNEGLGEVVGLLESVKLECAPLTYADLYQLAGVVGVRALGGPEIEFRAGRRDSRVSPPEGRLPAFQHCAGDPGSLLQRLQRAGLSKAQAVALCGAHPLGRWWSSTAKFEELWPRLEGSSPRANRPPPAFDSSIYKEILDEQDPLSRFLGQDGECRIIMRGYAADPELWMQDYAEAFQQLSEAATGLPPRTRRAAAGSASPLDSLTGSAVAAAVVAAGVALVLGVWWVRRRRARSAAQVIPSWRA